MTLFQGIILGILQGLTEFLPVSSSGHLVLGQLIFGLKESQLAFDISVHTGTLLAVLVVYAADIRSIIASVYYVMVSLISGNINQVKNTKDPHLNLAYIIIIGSIPTAAIGLFLKRFEHILFSSYLLVGCMLCCTGTFLWLSRRYYQTGHSGVPVSAKKGVIIGIAQGLAVLPGISRSGATIATGMFLGLDRQKAATLSFLMSIPAIIGAQILSIKDMMEKGMMIDSITIWATLISFVTGLIALKILIRLVNAGKFHLFAPYCWALGVLAIALHFL